MDEAGSDPSSLIVFFDLETIVPSRKGQGFTIVEFGAILVDARKLVELDSYSTLVRPTDSSILNSVSSRCNGITRDAISSAPTFSEISSRVYHLLHARIWAGHNISRFDCVRLRDAFAEIGIPAPEPTGVIDSLSILTQKFGRRAGDMKMASLASYFNLGQQIHRSLDDVRMNLEVVKHCATVLFLESSVPDVLTEKSWVSPNMTTRSRSGGKTTASTSSTATSTASNKSIVRNLEKGSFSSLTINGSVENELQLSETGRTNAFDMEALSRELTSSVNDSESNPCIDTVNFLFLQPSDVSISSISLSLQHFRRRLKLLHGDVPLQLSCGNLRVRFGLSTKFLDHAGRPKFSFVVDAVHSLCRVLDACDEVVRRFFEQSDRGSSPSCRPTVTRKPGFERFPTVRLNLIAIENDDDESGTEIQRKDSSGNIEKLSMADVGDVVVPGVSVDAWSLLHPYDYQHNAGIRLVVKKLVVVCVERN